MQEVKCTNAFSVNKYDGNGWLMENEYIEITAGSLWTLDEEDSRLIGGEIRLEGENYEWLEISRDLFNDCFESITA